MPSSDTLKLAVGVLEEDDVEEAVSTVRVAEVEFVEDINDDSGMMLLIDEHAVVTVTAESVMDVVVVWSAPECDSVAVDVKLMTL